jgi:predicted metal-binding protein
MEDLEFFRNKALDMEADAAEVIRVKHINVDERVRLKCIVPRCRAAGQCACCPPYSPDLDIIRVAFRKYAWAILLKTNVRQFEGLAPKNLRGYGSTTRPNKTKKGQKLSYHKNTNYIVFEIERLAYKYGYYLATR